jgi:hypothetical protein
MGCDLSEILSQHLLDRSEEDNKTCQDSRRPASHSSQVPQKYKVVELPLQPTCQMNKHL